MAYFSAPFTLPTTGTGKTIYGIPFTPIRARYTIFKTDSTKFHSAGSVDSTGQEANTTHWDVVPSGESLSTNMDCILHRKRVNGALVTALEASHHSFGLNKARFNVAVSDPNIQIIGEFWG